MQQSLLFHAQKIIAIQVRFMSDKMVLHHLVETLIGLTE